MLSDHIIAAFHNMVPQVTLTQWAGQLANVKTPIIKNFLIKQFIKKFKVNMSEAAIEDPKKYPTFNDFFIRKLKDTARPIAPDKIVSPVDGYISEIGVINYGELIQAKNWHYSLKELLAGHGFLQFVRGSFATIYLSPADYHRVHMPITGSLNKMIYIPGGLQSVKPAIVRTQENLFARNERIINFFDTEEGPMALIMVGATIVGGMATAWQGEIQRDAQQHTYHYRRKPEYMKGDEIGYFKLGSTVIILFSNRDTPWRHDLKSGTKIQLGESLISFQN